MSVPVSQVVAAVGNFGSDAAVGAELIDLGEQPRGVIRTRAGTVGQARRRWAMLIQRVYQVDPLRGPQCGGTMRVVSFIEARQEDLIREILEHCGLWRAPPSPDPPTRAPPAPCTRPAQAVAKASPGGNSEVDPDYLEYQYRVALDQPDLPWE